MGLDQDENVLYIKECNSTNEVIKGFIFEDCSTVVYTFNQTNGRGQYGRTWSVQPDMNIAISFAIPSKMVAFSDVLLSQYIALEVRDFIAKLTNLKVYIKWPNDIIVNNKKIAGILIEKHSKHYIIGVGVNVNQLNFDNLPNATSIKLITNFDFNLHNLSKQLMNKINTNLDVLEQEILPLFNYYLYKKNTLVEVKFNSKIEKIKIKEVDVLGNIILEFQNLEQKKIPHRDVEFLNIYD